MTPLLLITLVTKWLRVPMVDLTGSSVISPIALVLSSKVSGYEVRREWKTLMAKAMTKTTLFTVTLAVITSMAVLVATLLMVEPDLTRCLVDLVPICL